MSGNESSGRERVVVGVDGSESSKAALAWAGRQATLTGASIEAVAAWEYPTSYGWSVAVPEDLDLAEETRSMLSSTVEEVFGASPSVKPTETVAEGHPTFVLLEASKLADLLVVGCRGLGSFKGMLLGSVSSYLTAHAHCTIVVIHDNKDATHAR